MTFFWRFFFASLIQVTFHKKCFIKIFSTSTIFGKMFKEYLENTQTFVKERKKVTGQLTSLIW